MIDPNAGTSLIVVSPQPSQNDNHLLFQAFVLVVQHVQPTHAPVLFTRYEQGEYLHIAAFLPIRSTKREVFHAAGLSDRCLTARPLVWCVARIGHKQFGYDQLLIHVGANIDIGIFDLDEQARVAYTQQLAAERQQARADFSSVGTAGVGTSTSSRHQSASMTSSTRSPEATPMTRSTTVDFSPVHELYSRLHSLDLPISTEWPQDFFQRYPELSNNLHYPWWDGSQPSDYGFFTDASYKGNHNVGIGVILLVQVQGRIAIGGYMSMAHFGSSAFSGKQSALGWALLWASHLQQWHDQVFGQCPAHFAFHFDAQAAGHLAAGWACPAQASLTTTFDRAMGQCIEEFWGASWISWHHVLAHQGLLWNEIADRLANLGLELDTVTHPSWLVACEPYTESRALEWLWALRGMMRGDDQLP